MLISDKLSAYRVFPRLFSLMFIYLLYDVADWFMALDVPTKEQAGFAGIMIPTAAAWFKFYCEGGKGDD